jgi:hypothetical protein
MAVDAFVTELRRFILTYAEHDPDCPGIEANVWEEQRRVCVCGLAPRLDELLAILEERLAKGTEGGARA